MTRRPIDRVCDAAGYVAGFFVFAIFVVMLGTTALREFGGRTGGSDDLVSWMTAAAAFFGLAHAFKHGDFVRVVLLIERFGPRGRRLVELVSLGVAAAFTGFLAWSVGRYVLESWRFGDMAGGLLVIPIWIPQSSLVIGTTLLFVAVVDEFILVARGRRPTYVTAVEERHARGDFSEDM